MYINPLLLKDGYKVNHYEMYPKGTELVFSNFTPRKSRLHGIDYAILFGMKYFVEEYLGRIFTKEIDLEDGNPLGSIEYAQFMKQYLGIDQKWPHIEALYNLGHLPIAIYALPELTKIPIGVPAFVIHNTKPEFYWVTNMLETIMSCILWGGSTSATTASAFRELLDSYAAETSDMPEFVDYQAHDFSFRGMFGLEAALLSGSAHLSYFKGTDSIPAILFNENYYGNHNGASVAATEHAIMCADGKDNEFDTYKRLLTETYPTGIVSIVSDTYDFWKVINEYLPALKDIIMNRDGKCVIRPDSGNPVDILCGQEIPTFKNIQNAESWAEDECQKQAYSDCEGSYNYGSDQYNATVRVEDKFYKISWGFEYDRHDKTYYFIDESEHLSTNEITIDSTQIGLIERLWQIFGGTINSKGYKQLDPHIGAIYGDSINLTNCKEILERLKTKGFASTNVIFGIGSYSYQYVTRDTLGWAMKATYVEINGKGHSIFKDPKTDDGTKKSHKGLLKVIKENGQYRVQQEVSWDEFHAADNELKLIYKDGVSYL